jgi:hypothetical protein
LPSALVALPFAICFIWFQRQLLNSLLTTQLIMNLIIQKEGAQQQPAIFQRTYYY